MNNFSYIFHKGFGGFHPFRRKYRYSSKNMNWIIAGLVGIFLLLLIFIISNYYRFTYEIYASYEESIYLKQDKINKEVQQHINDYNNSKISRAQMAEYLNTASSKMESLYDSLKWFWGDAYTKELYVLRKQILISYSIYYKDKAWEVTSGKSSFAITEDEKLRALNLLYFDKDRIQNQRYSYFYR